MTELARRHDLTAVSLVDAEFDLDECRSAMEAYFREVVLIPNPRGITPLAKRVLQLRSLGSRHSFEHLKYALPSLQGVLDALLRKKPFDVVHLEFPYLAHLHLRQSPPATMLPALVIDTHEIEFDIVRQFARHGATRLRRLYASFDWRKLRVEERRAFASADGVCVCSEADRRRLLAEVPAARSMVVPNAADVEHYQPRPNDPPSDGRTVVFFGQLSTVPNTDGAVWFLKDIWPRIVLRRPDARCRVIGRGAPAELRELGGANVEIVGFVEDLRPEIAAAAALVVPLRLGGGTRLKIVEGMAMAKPIVSTTLGAEGIDAVPERDIVLAEDPQAFADAVVHVLDDPPFAARVGAAARRLAVERYSWAGAASALENFYGDLLAPRQAERRIA